MENITKSFIEKYIYKNIRSAIKAVYRTDDKKYSVVLNDGYCFVDIKTRTKRNMRTFDSVADVKTAENYLIETQKKADEMLADTWDDVEELCDTWERWNCKPNFDKLKEGTVLDEDKSVRWNREQVEQNSELPITKVTGFRRSLTAPVKKSGI